MENDKIADAFQGKKGYNDKNDRGFGFIQKQTCLYKRWLLLLV